jgi:maleylacetoacetate isomerase
MKLYSRWQNSAGERVRIALNLKGIAYDYVPVSSLPPGEYRRLNPQGLMPTLEVDESFVAQSSAILEYLEETFPTPALLPDKHVLRAQARAFGAHVTAEMHAIMVNRVRKFLADGLNVGEVGVKRWVEHWTRSGFTALEATLAGRSRAWPFCFGEEPGWADLHLIPQLANARRTGCDLQPYPTLLAVEANCVGLDAFRLARPEMQPDFPGNWKSAH